MQGELLYKLWDDNTKLLQVHRYKRTDVRPRIALHHNGGKRRNGSKCFDIYLVIGRTIIGYTNYDLQKERKHVNAKN